MTKVNMGVHASHCCQRHGCKYGFYPHEDAACPVVAGDVAQKYLCERCAESADQDMQDAYLLNTLYDQAYAAGQKDGARQTLGALEAVLDELDAARQAARLPEVVDPYVDVTRPYHAPSYA